jgi:hypothetical protein
VYPERNTLSTLPPIYLFKVKSTDRIAGDSRQLDFIVSEYKHASFSLLVVNSLESAKQMVLSFIFLSKPP